MGNGSVANAYNSLAALGGTTGEKATNSVAIGTGATVGGAYVLGNTETEGANAFAFGYGAQATLSNSVALGSGAVANRAKYNASNNAYKAYLNEDDNNQKTDPAWRATHNAIAVGSDDTSNPVTRQIIGVAAGSADTDAVNVAQLKAATFSMQGITRTRSGNDNDGYTYTTTIEGKLSVSSNGAFSISGDKFKVDSDGAISAADGKFTVGAEGTLSAGTTTVSGLTVGTKNRTKELTTDGEIADGEAGAGYVTGSTVATALAGKADVATTLAGYGITDAYTKTETDDKFAMKATDLAGYGITDAAKINASNLTAENVTSWSAKLGTGAVDSGNDGLVTGGTVYAVTSALDTRITANTTALENKAGVDLANISDAGKTAIKNLITVKQGANVTVTKTIENGVDTYAIEAIAATGSGAYNSGNGIAIDGTKINVNNGGGLTFKDNDNKLTIYTGDDLTIDGSGKLQVVKTGEVNGNDPGLVMGKTVYSALSAYAKSDGATLENVTINSGNVTDSVKLGAADSTITVGTLKASVATNTSDISALNETINTPETGLVAKVTKNTDAIGDTTTGLIKDVKDNANAISTINSSISEINTSITSLSTNKANVDLDNISDNGKAAVRGLAKGSVKVVAGTNTTVTKGADGNADTYAVDVVANGSVASGDTGLVAGGICRLRRYGTCGWRYRIQCVKRICES